MDWYESKSHQGHEKVIKCCFQLVGGVVPVKNNLLLDSTASWGFSPALAEMLVWQRLCFCMALDDPKLTARLLCSSNLKQAVHFGKMVIGRANIGSVVFGCLVYIWLTENEDNQKYSTWLFC